MGRELHCWLRRIIPCVVAFLFLASFAGVGQRSIRSAASPSWFHLEWADPRIAISGWWPRNGKDHRQKINVLNIVGDRVCRPSRRSWASLRTAIPSWRSPTGGHHQLRPGPLRHPRNSADRTVSERPGPALGTAREPFRRAEGGPGRCESQPRQAEMVGAVQFEEVIAALFMNKAGIKAQYTPYKDSNEAMPALAGGFYDVGYKEISGVVGLWEAKKNPSHRCPDREEDRKVPRISRRRENLASM